MVREKESSGGAPTPAGAVINAPCKATKTNKARRVLEALSVRLLADGQPLTVHGRLAQTLALLIRVGARGFTSGEASSLGWARRTSHYIFALRGLGVPIGKTLEATPDGARVARYHLTAPVVAVTEGGGE
jgi:hypothetical protein